MLSVSSRYVRYVLSGHSPGLCAPHAVTLNSLSSHRTVKKGNKRFIPDASTWVWLVVALHQSRESSTASSLRFVLATPGLFPYRFEFMVHRRCTHQIWSRAC